MAEDEFEKQEQWRQDAKEFFFKFWRHWDAWVISVLGGSIFLILTLRGILTSISERAMWVVVTLGVVRAAFKTWRDQKRRGEDLQQNQKIEIAALKKENETLNGQINSAKPETPLVSIEGLMMPYGVQDFSGFRHGLPVGLDVAPTKMVEKFFVKVRNQSSFAVNIDAVGFMVKDTPLQGYFVDDSNTPLAFPIRLEARASLTARFFKLAHQGHSLNEIDGLYVETGCGHTFTCKDSKFAAWSLTADIRGL